MRKIIWVLVTTFMMSHLFLSQAAAQEGDAILAKIDSVMNAPSDMTAVEKMTLIDKNGSQRLRDTKIYQKGSEWRLVRFLSPADVRDVGFLRLAEDRLYLYLPAFRKVRRIASSVKNENFMGTDFSYEDMSQSEYRNDYSAKLLEEKDGQYLLELTPRPGADVSYGRLVLYADKSNYVYRKIEYYNTAGKLGKILTVDNVEQIEGYWFGRRMEMQTVKDGHRTVLDLSEIQFDQGLSDNIFSQRNLKKPER
ncbi:MAG: outer membrane lipoprotein-sorting protein [Bacteroidota bacterium]